MPARLGGGSGFQGSFVAAGEDGAEARFPGVNAGEDGAGHLDGGEGTGAVGGEQGGGGEVGGVCGHQVLTIHCGGVVIDVGRIHGCARRLHGGLAWGG